MAGERIRLRYCYHCGHEVETYTIQRAHLDESRCSGCGYPVDVAPHHADVTDSIGVAEPNPQILEFISKVVADRCLARKVVTAETGLDFLSLFTERIAARHPVRLAILGTPMPHLDGPSTALAMRAIERGLKRTDPTPILFVYPAWTEDPLRGLISLCQPALYIAREVNPEESGLADRLEKAVINLIGMTPWQMMAKP